MIISSDYVLYGGSRDHIELVAVKGELLFFKQRDGPYLPTLKLLHKCECNSMSDAKV